MTAKESGVGLDEVMFHSRKFVECSRHPKRCGGDNASMVYFA
jgi:hypothetical protein